MTEQARPTEAEPGLDSQRPSGAAPVILLAAGEGRRLGQCKPLARLGDRSLIDHAIALLKPLTCELVVVIGYQALRVRAQCTLHPHRWLVNPDWAAGQASSLQAGLRSLGPAAMGALVCLVDQPGIGREHYQSLLRAAWAEPGQAVVTRARGVHMPPAYIPRALWEEVFRLRGDQGARTVLACCRRTVDCPAAADDIDTPADLQRHRAQLQF